MKVWILVFVLVAVLLFPKLEGNTMRKTIPPSHQENIKLWGSLLT